ncbi:ABC-2 type transport system permease protein [Eubacterium ruminantium]|uniref:ABC-2 type transport system permease protein n=1 Tax=Eubacterium ruminantium TaxID=42322 RepID=A0A1T4KI97_9FIRM|nr:ABC transporter permease subunit [Eubacterium ruminantium]SCW32289.1 ABC-2 type transport system permease protein [Eubacterium ruminantium]SDM27659.1 ABC-2 type transport system permease protein [Eubacterium ruminantium]SJZ42168.1 ABC-2 type transport system permease protein [Eubacterium ruminantium]
MRSLNAVIGKEFKEQYRSGKIYILLGVFALIGIMNPFITKLTPVILEKLSGELADQGFVVGKISANALNSWEQFYKNIPLGLISFILMMGSILTKELESGTIILTLTKGLKRSKVIISKYFMMIVLWSVYYWMCFGITYGYNEFYWDNSIANNIEMAAFFWWLFGILMISALIFVSSMSGSGGIVLAGTGLFYIIMVLAGMFPKIRKYICLRLTDGVEILKGTVSVEDYLIPAVIAGAVSLFMLILSICIFNKRRI